MSSVQFVEKESRYAFGCVFLKRSIRRKGKFSTLCHWPLSLGSHPTSSSPPAESNVLQSQNTTSRAYINFTGHSKRPGIAQPYIFKAKST
jgi:hypothetical protein